jgi:hypothetical protein
MNTLLSLWTAVIPATPLVLGHGAVVAAAADVLLGLCVTALWVARERATALPKPFDMHGEERLAA